MEKIEAKKLLRGKEGRQKEGKDGRQKEGRRAGDDWGEVAVLPPWMWKENGSNERFRATGNDGDDEDGDGDADDGGSDDGDGGDSVPSLGCSGRPEAMNDFVQLMIATTFCSSDQIIS